MSVDLASPEVETAAEEFPALGKVSFHAKNDAVGPVEFDRICVVGGKLMLLSGVMASMHVKAVHAILHLSSGKTNVKAEGVKVNRPGLEDYRARNVSGIPIMQAAGGYERRWSKIGYGEAHALWVSREEGFMAVLDDVSLWNQLKDSRFTTPLVREWVPYLKQRLIDEGLLKYGQCYRCTAGMLEANSDQLDQIVEKGLVDGAIEIPDPRVIDTTAHPVPTHLALEHCKA